MAASEIYLFSELSPLFIYRWSVARTAKKKDWFNRLGVGRGGRQARRIQGPAGLFAPFRFLRFLPARE